MPAHEAVFGICPTASNAGSRDRETLAKSIACKNSYKGGELELWPEYLLQTYKV